MKNKYIPFIFTIILLATFCLRTSAQQETPGPKVLIVIAHPDDESGFACTIYKITHDLRGQADICLVTNGEGGYKYSTLAEDYYGIELTDEKTGRKNLPTIRKRELMNAGKILGITNFFMLDQMDNKYTLNEKDPLDTTWDVEFVKRRLNQIMTKTHYDYVFTLLPSPGTHGGHKAATILALETIKNLNPADRPIVLSGTIASKGDTSSRFHFSELPGYPVTRMKRDSAVFTFDRTTSFGFNHRLNYKIIAYWELAEHKSQGATQMYMNQGDYEKFWYFALNDDAGIAKTQALFDRLKIINYKSRTY